MAEGFGGEQKCSIALLSALLALLALLALQDTDDTVDMLYIKVSVGSVTRHSDSDVELTDCITLLNASTVHVM